MNKTAELAIWHVSGWLAPALQAYLANKYIKTFTRKSVDESGRFDEAFVACWEGRLGDDQVLGQMADQIYEHEASRRESIAAKAQSSLNAISLVLAALSFCAAVVGTQFDPTKRMLIWVLLFGGFYFLMAFILASLAVHVHRYVAVEYDELDDLIGKREARASSAVARGIRARRLAAVFQNRQQTLRVSNLVEASFLSLRNGILILLVAGVFILVSSAPEGSGVTCDEIACEAGPGGRTERNQGSTGVPRSRYHKVWPRG